MGNSQDDPARLVFFAAEGQRTRGAGYSYRGWDRNRLFLNREGVEWIEVGYHLGVSLQQDSRNVATDDLDGDGRVDLVVTTFEEWPERKQTLRVFRNVSKEAGNWVGVDVKGEATGAVVVLEAGQGERTLRPLVTGDSFRTQHSRKVHFGLGQRTNIERIEVRRPGGGVIELRDPAINNYHPVLLQN